MTYSNPFDAAKQVAGILTPHGNRRQLPDLPCGRHRWKPRKIGVFDGNRKIGTANACGNRNKNFNAFASAGFDVRRVISCH